MEVGRQEKPPDLFWRWRKGGGEERKLVVAGERGTGGSEELPGLCLSVGIQGPCLRQPQQWCNCPQGPPPPTPCPEGTARSSASVPHPGLAIRAPHTPGYRAQGHGLLELILSLLQREVLSAAVVKVTIGESSPKVKSGPRKVEPRGRGRKPKS